MRLEKYLYRNEKDFIHAESTDRFAMVKRIGVG